MGFAASPQQRSNTAAPYRRSSRDAVCIYAASTYRRRDFHRRRWPIIAIFSLRVITALILDTCAHSYIQCELSFPSKLSAALYLYMEFHAWDTFVRALFLTFTGFTQNAGDRYFPVSMSIIKYLFSHWYFHILDLMIFDNIDTPSFDAFTMIFDISRETAYQLRLPRFSSMPLLTMPSILDISKCRRLVSIEKGTATLLIYSQCFNNTVPRFDIYLQLWLWCAVIFDIAIGRHLLVFSLGNDISIHAVSAIIEYKRLSHNTDDVEYLLTFSFPLGDKHLSFSLSFLGPWGGTANFCKREIYSNDVWLIEYSYVPAASLSTASFFRYNGLIGIASDIITMRGEDRWSFLMRFLCRYRQLNGQLSASHGLTGATACIFAISSQQLDGRRWIYRRPHIRVATTAILPIRELPLLWKIYTFRWVAFTLSKAHALYILRVRFSCLFLLQRGIHELFIIWCIFQAFSLLAVLPDFAVFQSPPASSSLVFIFRQTTYIFWLILLFID